MIINYDAKWVMQLLTTLVEMCHHHLLLEQMIKEVSIVEKQKQEQLNWDMIDALSLHGFKYLVMW